MRFAFILFAVLAAVLPQSAFATPLAIVELYQSQGCSSCPPAIQNANALADRPDILMLMFAVTYWDRLGWKDTFARSEFTQRQYDYAHGLGHANVYTPQIIINGRADLDGTNSGQLVAAIDGAMSLHGPEISFAGGSVRVGDAATGAPSDVWLVRYDPRVTKVQIGAGENSGVTIAHRNVVRSLTRLGAWNGTTRTFSIPAGGDPAWRTAILVQGAHGGQILSANAL